MSLPLLSIKNLSVDFRQGTRLTNAVRNASLDLYQGETLALVGESGSGKSVTAHSVLRLLPVSASHPNGEIIFDGNHVQKWPPYKIARTGIGLVPEGRHIFPNLSVYENLEATSSNRFKIRNPWTLDRVLELFPRLKDRLKNMGNQLSGGEQQMLAIGRALMLNPRLLLLDEPSLGLSPKLVEEIFTIIQDLHKSGVTILLVEQNVNYALKIADYGYVLTSGKIFLSGTYDELYKEEKVRDMYLGEGQYVRRSKLWQAGRRILKYIIQYQKHFGIM